MKALIKSQLKTENIIANYFNVLPVYLSTYIRNDSAINDVVSKHHVQHKT